jgi:hypothetical protein
MRAEDTVAISSLFRRTGSLVPVVMLLAGSLVAPPWARAQAPAAPPQTPAAGAATAQAAGMATMPSDEEIERFLKEAKIVSRKGAGKGVTNSTRATLSDGTLKHDAHIQTVNESRQSAPTAKGIEFNFRDYWAYNIAAYKLDRMLGMNIIPVSIEREYDNKPAAYTWWLDDILMEEGDRQKKKIQSPRPAQWVETMQMVRLFDQLIANVDRNLGNLLITNDWHVWAIDHTRAFRTNEKVKTPEAITRCDRAVFERLKALNLPALKADLGKYLTEWEIKALLSRRDEIVAMIEKAGPTGLYDWRR